MVGLQIIGYIVYRVELYARLYCFVLFIHLIIAFLATLFARSHYFSMPHCFPCHILFLCHIVFPGFIVYKSHWFPVTMLSSIRYYYTALGCIACGHLCNDHKINEKNTKKTVHFRSIYKNDVNFRIVSIEF